MHHPTTLAALLLGGALLTGCDQKSADTNVAAVPPPPTAPADTMGVPAGTIPTIGNPQLLSTLPDEHNTPDGLAISADGQTILLSAPNLANNSYPAAILEITGNTYKPFAMNLPLEPTTQKAAPMDLAFGPDGNVYYVENQYENSKKYVSRLMRINMQNGRPGTIETAVDSFRLANGGGVEGQHALRHR